jgi:hypothetical protein
LFIDKRFPYKEFAMTAHFVTYRPFRDESKPDLLDRYYDFLSWREEGAIEGWSARNTFRPGDLALFYLTAPLMAIVGLGLVDRDPYVVESTRRVGYKNPIYCHFRPVWFLENRVPIKDTVQRQGLQTWWKTCPYRSIRRIELSVARTLLREILTANRDLERELQSRGWKTSQPLDFRLIPQGPSPSPEPEKIQWEIEDLLAIHWRQFENLMGEVFKRKFTPAQVEITSPRVDGGADIIITVGWPLRKEIVKCKRYRLGGEVSEQEIRKLASAVVKFEATKGYLATTSEFSRNAADFARYVNVKLIGGGRLIEMINELEDFPSPPEFARLHPRQGVNWQLRLPDINISRSKQEGISP